MGRPIFENLKYLDMQNYICSPHELEETEDPAQLAIMERPQVVANILYSSSSYLTHMKDHLELQVCV